MQARALAQTTAATPSVICLTLMWGGRRQTVRLPAIPAVGIPEIDGAFEVLQQRAEIGRVAKLTDNGCENGRALQIQQP
eukprot:15189550-Alexandrium_andersonii.AAC.1